MSTNRHNLSDSGHNGPIVRQLRLLVGLTYAASQEAMRRGDEQAATWTPIAEAALAAWDPKASGHTLEHLDRLVKKVESHCVIRAIDETRRAIDAEFAPVPCTRWALFSQWVAKRVQPQTV